MGVVKGNKGSGVAVVWWCLLLAGLLFLAAVAAASAEAESGGRGIVNTKEDRRWCKKDCEWKKDQCMHECRQQQEQEKGGGDDDDDKASPKEEHRDHEYEHVQCTEEENHHGGGGGQGHGGAAACRCRQECKQRYRHGDERQQCLQDCEISPGGRGAGGRGREQGDEPHHGWETAAGAILREV